MSNPWSKFDPKACYHCGRKVEKVVMGCAMVPWEKYNSRGELIGLISISKAIVAFCSGVHASLYQPVKNEKGTQTALVASTRPAKSTISAALEVQLNPITPDLSDNDLPFRGDKWND